jgi:restriction system protein
MSPLLAHLSDGKDHRVADLYEPLADSLHLSQEDRNEMLPSGAQLVYINRIGWARTYLKKAGLIEQASRGVVRITARGKEVLNSRLEPIDTAFLGQYPEFVSFRESGRNGTHEATGNAQSSVEESPEDTLNRIHTQLRNELANELLERIKAAPPSFFERLIVDLMIKMGYGGSREDAGRTVGRSGDGGIDGVINEDRLGLDVIYLQAKRWENTVGRPVVQGFVGSLAGKRAKKGVMITTSNFSKDAHDYVQQIGDKVVLIDGETLGSLMIQYGLAVTPVASYDIKRVDSDYFDE